VTITGGLPRVTELVEAVNPLQTLLFVRNRWKNNHLEKSNVVIAKLSLHLALADVKKYLVPLSRSDSLFRKMNYIRAGTHTTF
jgi:hypothetical protein